MFTFAKALIGKSLVNARIIRTIVFTRRAQDSTEAIDVIRGGIGSDVPTLFGLEVPRMLSIGLSK